MRAAVYRRYGPPEVLAIEQLPRPEPRDGLVIRMHATTVNPADTAARSARSAYARLAYGLFSPKYPVLGWAVSGEVVAGAELVGQEVVAVAGLDLGTHAEYVRVPAAGVVPKPASLSAVEAVALLDGGLTALPFLRDHGRVRPGQRVLVNGASGAVGSSAVQLGKYFGAHVTGVCSTANLDLVADLGADEVIDYTTTDFTEETYDVVFDAVGKSSYHRCRRALSRDGSYLTTVPSLDALWATLFARRPRAKLAFTGLRKIEDQADDIARLLRLADDGVLRTVIDRTYRLDDVAEAHRYVDTERKRGVVVVVP